MRRPRFLSCLLVVALLAPAAAPAVAPAGATERAAPPPDPQSDRIGWEAGYWHNESIDVDQSDGLSDAELDAYVGRAMARVEYVREREFRSSVPVSVIAREEYRNRSNRVENASESAFAAWNNQVWEALFIVGEDTNVQQELGSTYGSSVAGFYAPGADEIKIITDTPERPTIDNATLVHELTHALQDQYVNLSAPRYTGETQDGDLAIDGIVEGEANYVERRYTTRCGAEWECVPSPARGGDGGGNASRPNLGVLLTILQPYSDGPHYVARLRERGGWTAVNERMRSPPVSTEQTIHVTDERPVPISFTDRARNGWRPFPDQGVNGSDTVGEASMYAMLWYQARTADADTVPVRSVGRTDGEFDRYNYAADPTAGWGNDRVFPYRKGSGADAASGYVWVTEWDTPRDAREFLRAYQSILRAHNATRRDDGVYVVEEGRFADAFLVSRNGTRVTIVNGPTPAAVADIRPGADPASAAPSDDGLPTGIRAPGFGPVAAAAALALLALLARRHG